MAENVGVIGCGIVGTAVAKALLASGHSVTVHDMFKDKAQPLLDAGASWADSPALLAKELDVLLTALPAPRHVRAAMEELLADGLGLGSAAAAAAVATPGVATVAATATASQLLDNRYASRPRAPPPARPRPHSTTATVTRVATVAVASGAAIYLLWRWQRARRRRRDEGSTRRLSRKK